MCTGAGKHGALRVVRSGVGINAQAALEVPGIKGLWALRQDDSAEYGRGGSGVREKEREGESVCVCVGRSVGVCLSDCLSVRVGLTVCLCGQVCGCASKWPWQRCARVGVCRW
jgi:hypothetical protein